MDPTGAMSSQLWADVMFDGDSSVFAEHPEQIIESSSKMAAIHLTGCLHGIALFRFWRNK